ncbi:hypothetical protein [Nocardia concava]|uniref:hypothetical protein n=1 Tax=Nocardia concava TaxID=257281 RepID=UPI00030F2A4E|nr:hypothetical protein [Nocardia concava]
MYDYSLDWKYAAAPDKHPRPQPCGYLIGLHVDATTKLAPDVLTPATYPDTPQYPGIGIAYEPATKQMRTCGIIESLHWDGDPQAPIQMSYYVSEANQHQLHNVLRNANQVAVSELRFWVIGYEYPAQSGKPGTWYEAAYPIGAPAGIPGALHGRINRTSGKLDFTVSEIASPVHPTGAKMYQCTMSVLPAADTVFTLYQATSPYDKKTYNWGGKIRH